MPHLLLIDATLGAVAIMLAAWIVLRRWWSDRRSQRQGEVAWLAGEGTAPGEMTVVPGLSEGEADPDPGAREPAGFDRAPPQVSDVDGADSGADEPEPGAGGCCGRGPVPMRQPRSPAGHPARMAP